ncbi:MAG: acyl-CoA dehydrogenase family protein [Deltaproteobacteria bacterium]|nr:acyl-CoA dehydrogenase family protein [Deltaproteobacteria bacterium]
MNFEPNETQQAVRATARAFARDRIEPVAAALAREHRFPADLVRESASLGLLGVNIAEEYGGAAVGPVALALAIHEIARVDAAFCVTVAVTNMVAEVIAAFGTAAQKRKYLPCITGGEALCAAFALSEAESASDAGALRTVAERRGDRWVLTGEKQWISHGNHAGVIVVWARTRAQTHDASGVSAFLVEGGMPGLTVGRIEDKMGLNASPTVALQLEGCEVPADALLGEEGGGFKLAMMALDGGRINIAAQATGVGRAAMHASARYAKDRQAFGKPLFEQQAIQWFLADMRTQLEAAELLMLRAAWLKEQNKPFGQAAAMAKLYAIEAANRICDKAVEIHGGNGNVGGLPVERWFRDARVQTIYEGTSEIQRTVIARQLLA